MSRAAAVRCPVIRDGEAAPAPEIGETRHDMTREAKTALIQIRISDDEKKAWQAAADASDMTMSEWIRIRCNGSPAMPPELPRKRS